MTTGDKLHRVMQEKIAELGLDAAHGEAGPVTQPEREAIWDAMMNGEYCTGSDRQLLADMVRRGEFACTRESEQRPEPPVEAAPSDSWTDPFYQERVDGRILSEAMQQAKNPAGRADAQAAGSGGEYVCDQPTIQHEEGPCPRCQLREPTPRPCCEAERRRCAQMVRAQADQLQELADKKAVSNLARRMEEGR